MNIIDRRIYAPSTPVGSLTYGKQPLDRKFYASEAPINYKNQTPVLPAQMPDAVDFNREIKPRNILVNIDKSEKTPGFFSGILKTIRENKIPTSLSSNPKVKQYVLPTLNDEHFNKTLLSLLDIKGISLSFDKGVVFKNPEKLFKKIK